MAHCNILYEFLVSMTVLLESVLGKFVTGEAGLRSGLCRRPRDRQPAPLGSALFAGWLGFAGFSAQAHPALGPMGHLSTRVVSRGCASGPLERGGEPRRSPPGREKSSKVYPSNREVFDFVMKISNLWSSG